MTVYPRTSPEHRARQSGIQPEAGFTLMELLIVMSIMLIIMAFAVPQMLKVKKHANETSALQSIRVINSAEFQYNSAYQTFGCPVALLGGDPKAGAPSPEGAQLLDPTLAASGHKSGYVFTVTCGSKATINNQDKYNSFELTAIPETVGRTGDYGYCSDENNIIKYDPTGGTNCTQPVQ
jgi:type IV pilus assembly protein PilA